MQASPNRALVRYDALKRGRLKLICFPYAGGSAAIYRDWSEALSAYFDVISVEYPGRGARRREKPVRRIVDLVQGLMPEFLTEVTGPFIVFGHSMGALVALEMTRALSEHRPALAAIMSGCRPPIVKNLEREIYALPNEEFIEEIRKLDGTPEEILADSEMMALALPILRADFEAVATYAPSNEFKLPCPVLAYGGLDDQSVSLAEVEQWCAYASGFFSVRAFPGNHFFLQSAQQEVLIALRQDIFDLKPPLSTSV